MLGGDRISRQHAAPPASGLCSDVCPILWWLSAMDLRASPLQVSGLFSAAAAGIALPARAARHAPEEEMAIDGDAEEADAAPQRSAVSYADL